MSLGLYYLSQLVGGYTDSRTGVKHDFEYIRKQQLMRKTYTVGGYLDTRTGERFPMSLDPKTSKQDKLKVCAKALHPEFSYPLIDVAEMSSEKGYEPFNWLKPDNKVTVSYLLSAAQRHLDQVKLGYDWNTEEKTQDGKDCTTTYHAACAAYNLLMLVLQQKKGVVVDDRLFKDGALRDKKE